MYFRHVVVDGSNIATEGRSIPSLAQLDEAVREFRREFPDAEVTVVVDASFGHRIDESEREVFEEAEAAGEVVSPPAGAIGRGDAFLLMIAERIGATVLSNDSFQEFHGEHEWLFDKDRLIGGKPVPGVGWIFTPRNPVRGPKSREAVREARRSRVRIGSKEASQPMPIPKAPPPSPIKEAPKAEAVPNGAPARPAHPGQRASEDVLHAIEEATDEVASSPAPVPRKKRAGSPPPPHTVNDPLPFVTFIANHPLGSSVEGEVEAFTSHGAFVQVDGARCYVPLSAMADPPPRRARDMLSKGEKRIFVLQALDPQRRGIELALPDMARVSGQPLKETVDAEVEETDEQGVPEPKKRTRKRTVKKAQPEQPTSQEPTEPEPVVATATQVPEPQPQQAQASAPAPRRRRSTKAAAASAASSAATGEPTAAAAAADEPVVAPTDGASDEQGVAEPKKRTRKRTVKKAQPEQPAEPEPVVATGQD